MLSNLDWIVIVNILSILVVLIHEVYSRRLLGRDGIGDEISDRIDILVERISKETSTNANVGKDLF